MRDHTAEGLVFGHLDGQHVPVALIKRAAGPQNHAVRVGVARGDSFGIEVAPLAPTRARFAGRSAPRERRADRRGNLDEIAAAERHVLSPCKRRGQASTSRRYVRFSTSTELLRNLHCAAPVVSQSHRCRSRRSHVSPPQEDPNVLRRENCHERSSERTKVDTSGCVRNEGSLKDIAEWYWSVERNPFPLPFILVCISPRDHIRVDSCDGVPDE